MITVVTLYRTGGPVYSREWVWALKRGLNRHLSNFDFKVLTDDPTVEHYWRVPLIHGWPGWFSKVELFRPGLFTGRVLYMDLDTLPVGDLSELASYDGPFAMLSDFYQPRIPASGVMAWSGDECAHLYEAFRSNPPPMRGRLDYWIGPNAKPARLQDEFPGQIVSFKRHAKANPPEAARLVCGHGQPRFSESKAGWAHQHWRSLATRAEELEAA